MASYETISSEKHMKAGQMVCLHCVLKWEEKE